MRQLSNPPPQKRWWQYFDIRDVAIACGVLFVCGVLLLNAYTKLYGGPDVVVYLDKDAKQPAELPLPETVVVAGDRAALWWSVFNKALETNNVYDARNVADSAVLSVYGMPK